MEYSFGDKFGYFEEEIEGVKTSDHVVLNADDVHVICVPVEWFDGVLKNAISNKEFPDDISEFPVRAIRREKFEEWYPRKLGKYEIKAQPAMQG